MEHSLVTRIKNQKRIFSRLTVPPKFELLIEYFVSLGCQRGKRTVNAEVLYDGFNPAGGITTKITLKTAMLQRLLRSFVVR